MLVQKIINAVIKSNSFKEIVLQKSIQIDACYQLNVVHRKEDDRHFYTLYFDFGVLGGSDKDIKAIVNAQSADDFTILVVK